MKKILLGLICLFSIELQAQTLYLKNNTFIPERNIDGLTSLSHFQTDINNRTYAIVQFSKTISLKDRKAIEAQTGIRFYDYLPQFAFLASIPNSLNVSQLSNNMVRAVLPYLGEYKIHTQLQQLPLPAWIQKEGNMLEIELEIHQDINQTVANALFAQHNIQLQSWRKTHKAIVRIPSQQLNTIASLAFVKFMQATSAPAVLENLKGTTDHRVNTIDNAFVTGIQYDGSGIGVSVGDDGEIGPHIDFQGRLTLHTANNFGIHADHVAGIVGGGGNFDPTTSGNARGTDIHVYDYYDNLNNAQNDYDLLGVRITSNSLGQGCNDGYNSDAQESDQLIRSRLSLMNVHSAGNSGGTTCGSVANGFYTITGGYKSGKNVITVGNVTNEDVIAGSSSKGPTPDGRIKPEIVGVGTNVYSTQPDNAYASFTGTSMSCPGTSGTLASLWQAYKETHAGADPYSAVMKAILLNTADDLGNKGPDYTYGYGRINARRAYEAIKNDYFFIDSTETFNTNEYNITIPAGVKQLKVLLYWHDLEGNLSSAVPLVNNLALRIKDDNSVIYNAWVLDKSTNAALLDLPATRGIDNVNNVEQITIDDVTAGDYSILVSGVDVPFGPQVYVVTVEMITEDLSLTYPHGGEAFKAGVTEKIRWDADPISTGDFTLEYSEDGGTVWTTISSTIPGNVRHYDWTPPATLMTGNMMMRISRGAFQDVTDTAFTVIGVATNLVVDTACENQFHLSWDAVTGADGYIVYGLGTKYMVPIATSNTNEIYINTGVDLVNTFYFAVAATNSVNGAVGRRTIVYVKLPGEVNCVDNIYNVQTILPFESEYNCAVSNAMPIKVKLKNIGLKDVINFPVSYQINSGPIVVENCPTLIPIGDSIIYTFTTLANFSVLGNYTVKTWSHIWTDTQLLNDTSSSVAQVILPTVSGVPVVEDFEGIFFPPNGWKVYNPDSNVKWQKTICFSGATFGNTHAAYMDFFNYGSLDQIDELQTYQYDLSTVTMDSVILSFDISAAYNSLEMDTLMIMISDDCGKTFNTSSYKKWGVDLATVGSKSNIFSPTTMNHWRKDYLDLTSFIGSKIFLRFKAINRSGNNVYIDNINVSLKNANPNGVQDLENNSISIYPNPSDGHFNLNIQSNAYQTMSYRILNMAGQVMTSGDHKLQVGRQQIPIQLNAANGVYMIEVNVNGQTIKQKISKF